jgi:hypothetical protein
MLSASWSPFSEVLAATAAELDELGSGYGGGRHEYRIDLNDCVSGGAPRADT